MSTRILDLDVARIRRYAEDRVPAHARHQVRNEIIVRGTVTIVERRAPLATPRRPGVEPVDGGGTPYPHTRSAWPAKS